MHANSRGEILRNHTTLWRTGIDHSVQSLVLSTGWSDFHITQLNDSGIMAGFATKTPGEGGEQSGLEVVLLLPVEFKVYPDHEPGPYKPHLRNLQTRQGEKAFFGDRRKCVAHVYKNQWINLIDYLEGAEVPGLRALFQDNLDWQSNGDDVNYTLNWVLEPAENKISVYLIEVRPKGGIDVLDTLYLTVVPRSTLENFEAWYNSEIVDTEWMQELPPVFNRIELPNRLAGWTGNIARPDRNFNPYLYGVPHAANTRFHPDGYYELRSYKTPGGHGHQVFFDNSGLLLKSGVSAGSADRAAPFPENLNPFLHEEADVIPFMWALHLDGNPTMQTWTKTNLTRPIMHEGFYIGRYLEVRPALPNDKPILEPGATQ